ncbi:MAG: hypothetical protein JXA96_05750 [Sedimentisphaerales bacterium]|nr:hypothetical protein [Sedimentisphaerales bacterium]
MNASYQKNMYGSRKAFALVMVLVVAIVLTLLGVGLLQVCYGVRLRSMKLKRETIAMLAAEAGYEKGIFWMSQQDDVLTGLYNSEPGSVGSISFAGGKCDYEVQFYNFIGSRPIFRILSTGTSGLASRVVDVYVMQKITGWDMGKCRIPTGTSSTGEVNFANGEIINIPIHINNLKDSPDNRDIYIIGSPQFLEKVEMGESQNNGLIDKYSGFMGLFDGGILFDQPDVRITDEDVVQSKIDRFTNSTDPSYIFEPEGTANLPNPQSAVQLEFFVESAIGYVRITNNCTVRGANPGIYDYRIVSGTDGTQYEKYNIYAYHYKPDDPSNIITVPIEDTYVKQTFPGSGAVSDPGGQIFINGNVVIGSADYDEMVVKGKLTVVATGTIWIADTIKVSEPLHGGTFVPIKNNESVLGLISQRVIKVIDPGLSDDFGTLDPVEDIIVGNANMHSYVPVANGANTTTNVRYLPDPTIVIAAITVGGGGWGAENVGNRKEFDGSQDDLLVIGSISEAVRGVVGIVGTDGFIKKYTIDERLLEGVLPGNIWFGGKYIPAPAGWHDYRTDN